MLEPFIVSPPLPFHGPELFFAPVDDSRLPVSRNE
jgi:hypothetical protein